METAGQGQEAARGLEASALHHLLPTRRRLVVPVHGFREYAHRRHRLAQRSALVSVEPIGRGTAATIGSAVRTTPAVQASRRLGRRVGSVAAVAVSSICDAVAAVRAAIAVCAIGGGVQRSGLRIVAAEHPAEAAGAEPDHAAADAQQQLLNA